MQLLRSICLALCLLSTFVQASEELITVDDGSTVKVFLFYPDADGEGPWPLCILMSGGTANEYIARAQFWLGHELASRGWAIAVPVSPDSNSFFGKNGEKIPQVIARLQEHSAIRDGKSLLVGVSNGGSSALEIASQHPDNYFGVVAVPGIIKDETKIGSLSNLPVYLRIGENDYLRWNRLLPLLTSQLEEAGAEVNAKLVPNEGHVFPIDWDELQPWLDSVQDLD